MKSPHAMPLTPLHTVLLGGLLLALPLVAPPSHAAGPSSETSAYPVYQPPARGAPASRVGGASRGEQALLMLEVLAPEKGAGLTRQARPTLYWYISKDPNRPLEFTLIDDQAVKPLVEIPVTVSRAGIHALRLDYSLQPDVEYQWSVAAVADPQQRAGDTLASGTIQHTRPDPSLAARLDRAGPDELPFLYAEHGYWYDAIATLSEQIDAHPEERRWRIWRGELLKQVGLREAAAHDLGASP